MYLKNQFKANVITDFISPNKVINMLYGRNISIRTSIVKRYIKQLTSDTIEGIVFWSALIARCYTQQATKQLFLVRFSKDNFSDIFVKIFEEIFRLPYFFAKRIMGNTKEVYLSINITTI